MSKKTQTTGLPKRRRRRAASDPASSAAANAQADSDYKSRSEREARLQRLAIRGVIALVVLLVVLVGGAFAIEQLIVPSQVVARVNGDDITVQQFRDEYTLERTRLQLQLSQLQNAGFDMQQISQQEPYRTWLSEINVPDQLGLRVVNDMVDDRLMAQEAARRGLSVNDAAVQAEIEGYFGFDPTQVALIGVDPTSTPEPTITPTPYVSPTPTSIPSPTPSPTAGDAETSEDAQPTITPQPTVVEATQNAQEVRDNYETRRDDYRTYLSINGVPEANIDGFFQRMALQTLLGQDLLGDGSQLLYADVRHILVDQEAEAISALEALRAGESFADLARAISTDSGSGARGGELGGGFVSNYVREVASAIEAAEIGELVGPVKSEFGYHILQVRSREWRGGDDVAAQLARARQLQIQYLVEDLRAGSGDGVEVFDTWLDVIPRR